MLLIGSGMTMLVAGALALMAAGSAVAHHSQAMYDGIKRLTLTGTVKEFRWVNPHIQIKILVPDDEGGLVEWALEGSGVTQLRARGWRRNSLAAGDTVTVIVHPLRSGDPGGTITRVMRSDGSIIGVRPAT